MSEANAKLNEWFQNQLTEVHTCLPGKVISFDSTLQTCSVQPTLKRLFYGDDEATEIPIIEDVPVVFPGSGDFWVTFDVKADSYVLLVFCERSIAKWMELGGIVDPEAAHKFEYSDAIAIPGMLPEPAKLSGGVQPDSIEIRDAARNTYIKLESGSIEINGDTDFAVAYDNLATEFNELNNKFNALITAFNAHGHSGVSTGIGVTGPHNIAVAPTASNADITTTKVSTVRVP